MSDQFPRAVDLAEYVKQKDSVKVPIKFFPMITIGMPFLQDPTRLEEHNKLEAQAKDEITEVMLRYRLWRVDACISTVEVKPA